MASKNDTYVVHIDQEYTREGKHGFTFRHVRMSVVSPKRNSPKQPRFSSIKDASAAVRDFKPNVEGRVCRVALLVVPDGVDVDSMSLNNYRNQTYYLDGAVINAYNKEPSRDTLAKFAEKCDALAAKETA